MYTITLTQNLRYRLANTSKWQTANTIICEPGPSVNLRFRTSARLSHGAGLIRKRTRVSTGRLLSAVQRQSRKQSVPMSFESAGFAREINRAPRQGKQPSFAFTRACYSPESRGGCWATYREIEIEREKAREYPRDDGCAATMRPGDSMPRDSNWLPDSNSFSRSATVPRAIIAHACIEPDRKKKKACLCSSNISPFE